jgi:pimeloyl-ACP methyl ester carboxylesterase
MHHFLFVSGPPTGKRMWDAALDRMRWAGAECSALDLIDLSRGRPGPETWTTALAEALAHHDQPVLIAHGTAVPLARAAAVRTPPAGLVLSNGPLGPLPAAARVLTRIARTLAHRPTWVVPWLESSAGLRRWVVNPYVWDHDTVVTVCGPLFEVGSPRDHTTAFLRALPALASEAPTPRVPTLGIWGDNDRVFPVLEASLSGALSSLSTVTGGQHYHPLERPWEIADRARLWAEQTLTAT